MKYWLYLLLLLGCREPEWRYDGHFANVTAYSIAPTQMTPQGLNVDASGSWVDLAAIDAKVDAVEQCLQGLYPDGVLPATMVATGHCLQNHFSPRVHREALVIKVAPNWHVGCSGEQQFSCAVDPQLCVDKGLVPTVQCPCQCRSAIQDQDIIVTTPDLRMLDHDLIRIVTSCNYIWVDPLQGCFQ